MTSEPIHLAALGDDDSGVLAWQAAEDRLPGA